MKKWLFFLLITSLSACQLLKTKSPAPKTEFRGVWVASVANIDWPQSGQDSWEKQKSSYTKILDYYKDLNFNAVIVQIRTAGDAFYPTELAPWSRFLTGIEGEPPQTNEDPLQWLIEESHKKGFEFHAWFNPYRATFDMKTEVLSEEHDYYQHPDWMIAYGPKYYYDPGIPEVQDHLVSIMAEVASNYHIDGLHFDDYFYPYTRKDETFYDTLSFKQYAPKELSLNEWRRSNIDSLIRKVNDTLKATKPWVQFGISPFGVWQNKSQDPLGSDTRAGQTTYHDLYADPLLWMENGWIDYLVPQLYWSLDYEPASHRKLLDWWAENSSGINLYVGNAAYKIENNKDEAWDRKKEIPEQLLLTRANQKTTGNVFFSANSLMKKEKVSRFIQKKVYRYPALTPKSPLPRIALYQFPRLSEVHNGPSELTLKFKAEDPEAYKFAILYTSRKDKSTMISKPENIWSKIHLNNDLEFKIDKYALRRSKLLGITFVDLYGAESQPIILELDQYDSKK